MRHSNATGHGVKGHPAYLTTDLMADQRQVYWLFRYDDSANRDAPPGQPDGASLTTHPAAVFTDRGVATQ
jgi:hypothetical protein